MLDNQIVGYAACDDIHGKPGVVPVTRADIDAGNYDPNNHYPDACTALHPIVDRLWDELKATEGLLQRSYKELSAEQAKTKVLEQAVCSGAEMLSKHTLLPASWLELMLNAVGKKVVGTGMALC